VAESGLGYAGLLTILVQTMETWSETINAGAEK